MGVPQPMVGLLEDATLANIETARRIFWIDTIIPLLRLIRGQLNRQLAELFGDGWYIDYDISDVEALREDYSKKLEEASRLFAMGVPFNAINEHLSLGLEPIQGGDIGYLSAGLLPTDFDRTAPADPTVAQLAGVPPEMLKAIAYGRD
jgi:hypothetical protein